MKILSLALDPQVAKAREAALIQAGFDVRSPRDFKQLAEFCEGYSFDLAVIGHAFDPEVKRALAATVGRCQPTPQILEIYLERPILHEATAALGSLDLHDLVRQVDKMAEKIRSRSA